VSPGIIKLIISFGGTRSSAYSRKMQLKLIKFVEQGASYIQDLFLIIDSKFKSRKRLRECEQQPTLSYTNDLHKALLHKMVLPSGHVVKPSLNPRPNV